MSSQTAKVVPPGLPDIPWLNSEDVRPYIYMRDENRFQSPGSLHKCNWFSHPPIYKNPLHMNEVDFGNQILRLESQAFKQSDMPMPRWVFYDCAIVPGFVCGFAKRTSTMTATMLADLKADKNLEWTPISLFIIIPTLRAGEWVAHNLCTANSLVDDIDTHYALGFLTKAFGLWYANVEVLCGMTQWKSPAIRLHSHYGSFEILTAYTPIHSHARTLTYRCKIDAEFWPSFFKAETMPTSQQYKKAGFYVDPKDDKSLTALQNRIESGSGPYYLSPFEIRTQPLDEELSVYQLA